MKKNYLKIRKMKMYDFNIEKAKKCIASNKINEAIEILEILKNDSEYGYKFDVLFELSKAYVKSGNNKRAVENLEKCLNIQYDKNVYILLSGVFECEKRYRKSLKILFGLLKKGEKCKDIHERIIRILFNIKRYVWSKKYIDKYTDKLYYYSVYEHLMKSEFTFGGLSKRELLELEFLYNDLLNAKAGFNILNIEIKLLRLYCTGHDFFRGKEDFVNRINDKSAGQSVLFQKIYNTMLNTVEIASGKTELLSKPLCLAVTLTNKCNVLCKFCKSHKMKWELPRNTHKQILELIPFLHEIAWAGGEVFLYKDFYELFSCAKTNNVRQEIVTNAMLLDKKWLDEIMMSNTKLAISVRSVKKKLYETLSKGALFEKLIFNLEYMKKNADKKYRNFELAMYILVTRYNFTELEELIDFAGFYGFNTVRFIQLDNREDIDKGEDICRTESCYYAELLSVLNKAIKKAQSYGIRIRNELPVSIDYKRTAENHPEYYTAFDYHAVCENNLDFDLKRFMSEEVVKCSEKAKLFCRFPWNAMSVLSGGLVTFNCFCLSEKNVGNVSENSLVEIWNCHAVKNFRKKIIDNTYGSVCNSLCIKYGVHR